jgi:hypothetical protein
MKIVRERENDSTERDPETRVENTVWPGWSCSGILVPFSNRNKHIVNLVVQEASKYIQWFILMNIIVFTLITLWRKIEYRPQTFKLRQVRAKCSVGFRRRS